MSEELTPELIPMEDQMTQELVKANITEAIIAELRKTYLPLKIAGIEDKETYLLVKEGRKKCKTLRVEAKKICTNGREEAVAISKKWIAKEKDVTSRIGEVEDYLEEQEKEYEAQVAKEKEAKKRKQEEQLIIRQQTLAAMGVLYADGLFSIGEVKFDLAAIKESDDDIWQDSILPLYQSEYEKINEEEIAREKLRREREAELGREQEALEAERKRLSAEADRLKAEKDRQELEAAKRRSDQFEFRSQQLKSMGFDVYGVEWYAFREFKIAMAAAWDWDDNAWGLQLGSAKQYVDQVLAEEAEEKRKEQERKDLQAARLNELLPFNKFGADVDMATLWSLSEGEYLTVLMNKRSAFDRERELEQQRIAEEAAKKERERIEEEQRKAEVKRKTGLREFRIAALNQYNRSYSGDVAELTDEQWMKVINEAKDSHLELLRKQEEERKAEELAQASDKAKWADILVGLNDVHIHDFRSGQYRKKAAILREKLEEIKAL